MGPNLSGEIQRQLWWGVYNDNFIPILFEIGTQKMGHKNWDTKIGQTNWPQKLG